MTKPWTRDNTKNWVAQVENRVEDFEFYIKRALEWCDERGVDNENAIFACTVITVIWVSHMRGESVTKQEALEMLGVTDWYNAKDEIFELGPKYQDIDLEDLLEEVSSYWW